MTPPVTRARSKPRTGLGPAAAIKDLWPSGDAERSVALLKALHILTRDGGLNADSRRKLKQVLHLVALLRPSLDRMLAESESPWFADLGAGKSYLGFILYDLVLGPAGRGHVGCVESRADLVERSRAIAQECGFERIEFLAQPIAQANLPGGRADMVTALHACDTATDDAIHFALRHEAKVIALIPCCQAEVARLLDTVKGPLSQLWRHPIQRREFGAHLTNVIRGLYLESQGYKVRVTELVGLEHSLKNELILAERHQHANPMAQQELDRLVDQLGVRPGLLAAS
jgi:hypothetical protein